jgi:zinc protease
LQRAGARLLSLSSFLALTLALGMGVSSEAPTSQPATPKVSFREFTLKNGLRVILSEDHTAPTYSICLTYNVGSRDERPGRTGFAHLFEHMMFQGSANVGKGEHFILVLTNGGTANGTTNADRTNYFETLPANQLELGIFLEADRMAALNVTQANFDNQRHAVQEERRLNVDNRPYGKSYEAVLETAYDNFAYQHSTIGSMEDLNAAGIEDARTFFRTYYAPNNAVLSLVGDFQTEAALALIKKYFESIPSQAPPSAPDVAEPEQTMERRRTIEDSFAQTPRVDIVYKTVPGNTPDWYALRVLGHIMAGDLSSRLYQKLVKELEMVVSVSAGPDERRGTSLFWISLMVKPDKSLREVEKVVYDEIERLKQETVADWELEKVQMKLRLQQAQALYSTRSRANSLGQHAVYYNEPELINTVLTKITQVTRADLRRVAENYLKPANRTVVTTVPKSKAVP